MLEELEADVTTIVNQLEDRAAEEPEKLHSGFGRSLLYVMMPELCVLCCLDVATFHPILARGQRGHRYGSGLDERTLGMDY